MEEIKGYTKIVIETNEENPKIIATITSDDVDVTDDFRVRLTPVYD